MRRRGVLFAAALAGCGGGRNLPDDATWESEHFVYKTRAGEAEACAAIIPALEEHFQALQRALGFDWPQGAKVTYYKFETVSDFGANSACGEGTACAPGTTVEASDAFHPHELAHAYLRPTGYPPVLLLEGAAVALSCSSWRFPRPTIPWPEAFALKASGPRAVDLYAAGGWLAAFLLATRPVPSFMALYRDAAPDQSAVQFAATFARVYGESLDSVWAQMIAAGRPPAFCPWECSRPPAPVDGVTPVASATACGVPPTHALPLGEAGELVAALTGASNFSLGVCGAGSVPPAVFHATDGPTAHVDYMLAAGDYFVTGPFGDAATLTLARHPQGTFIRSACATTTAAPPWQDLRGGSTLAVMVPRGTWQIDVAWSSPASVVVAPPPSPSGATLCPACDAPSDACVAPVAAAARIEGTRTFRVTSAPPAGAPELVAAALRAQ
jgi:hypothetical protein